MNDTTSSLLAGLGLTSIWALLFYQSIAAFGILPSVGWTAISVLAFITGWITSSRFIPRFKKNTHTLVVKMYATESYATNLSIYPDYDDVLEGPEQDIKNMIENIEDVSVLDSNISQQDEHDIGFSEPRKKRRRATLTFKIATDPEQQVSGDILRAVENAVKEDTRHDGFIDAGIDADAMPNEDLREYVSEDILGDNYQQSYRTITENEPEPEFLLNEEK